MEEIFVDTSAWYALADGNDEFHAPARTCLQQLQLRGTRLHTTQAVFHETAALLFGRFNKATVIRWGEGVLCNPRITLHESDADLDDEAWLRFQKSGEKVSLVDCHSFVSMTRLGIRNAFTFDDDFANAGYEMVP